MICDIALRSARFAEIVVLSESTTLARTDGRIYSTSGSDASLFVENLPSRCQLDVAQSPRVCDRLATSFASSARYPTTPFSSAAVRAIWSSSTQFESVALCFALFAVCWKYEVHSTQMH